LVLSVALACWAGERYMTKLESVPKPGHIAAEAPINIVGGGARYGNQESK
jgi:hypothetical protein